MVHKTQATLTQIKITHSWDFGYKDQWRFPRKL